MEQDRIKLLVRQVVEAYMRETHHQKPGLRVTILLSYQSPYPTEVLKTITPLIETYDITFILSRSWATSSSPLTGHPFKVLEETTREELLNIVERSALLVVPVGSYQLLSKLALSIDDEVSIWLAIQYQLLGKPVIIAKDYVELNVYQQIYAPHSLKERIQSYIRQLQSDQVKWVSLKKLGETLETEYTYLKEKQTLILEKHVEKAYQDGLSEINAAKNTKLTPAARDLARELKINIHLSD